MSEISEYEFKYYDRATNQELEPNSDPKYCIEPVGQLKVTSGGNKYAVLVPLETVTTTRKYKKTLRQKIYRQKAKTYKITSFDFEKAHDALSAGVTTPPKPLKKGSIE